MTDHARVPGMLADSVELEHKWAATELMAEKRFVYWVGAHRLFSALNTMLSLRWV